MSKAPNSLPTYPVRRALILGLLSIVMALLIWRALDLQVFNKDFLQVQGEARHLRVVSVPAHRGMILDRNGEPLAISTPVDSVWANPQELLAARAQWPQLAKLLQLDAKKLAQHLLARKQREFVYLERRINPDLAQQVMALNIPGVSLQREYRRYYPTSEVSAHVLGFTNVDDVGQEGLELAYDDWLRGIPGSKRVLKDRMGHTVEDVESLRAPQEQSVALMISTAEWLDNLKARYEGRNIEFEASGSGDGLIPRNLFDSVAENLLENARRKRINEPDIAIRLTLDTNEKIKLLVCDRGSAIKSDIAVKLFSQPLGGGQSTGIGLYQAARQAQSAGFKLALEFNQDGAVCFSLSRRDEV